MKSKKLCSTLACILAATMMLSACGTDSVSQPEASESTSAKEEAIDSPVSEEEPKEEPLKLEIVIGYDGVEYPQPDNVIEKKIEEYTNTDLLITAYPGSTLHEMLPTMIASDELPMVVSFGGSQLSKSYMIEAMKAGTFWDLTDYIKDYPNIAKISQLTFDCSYIDGRLYGLPKQRGLSRDAVGYRYDWIENLGLEEPKTVDDLFNLMIAFTEQDPDGNGQDDTYGTCINPLQPLKIFLGGPNGWKYENGEMIRDRFTEEYQQALDMVKELYERGALHPEFSIHNRSQLEALWTEGRAGMYFNINDFTQYVMEGDADVHVNGVFSSDKGTFTSAGTGHNGLLCISKSKVKDEATLRRILQFFNDLGDEEMCNLLVLGIEGEHYNIEDGVAVPVEEKREEVGSQIYLPYAAPIAVAYPNLNTMPIKNT
nr:extracellular solute-binding protein [Acetatifactor sp.]